MMPALDPSDKEILSWILFAKTAVALRLFFARAAT